MPVSFESRGPFIMFFCPLNVFLFRCWCLPHRSPLNDGGPDQDTAGITTNGSGWSGADEGAKYFHPPHTHTHPTSLPPVHSVHLGQTRELQHRSNTQMAQTLSDDIVLTQTQSVQTARFTSFMLVFSLARGPDCWYQMWSLARSIFKKMVGIWPDQSESFKRKEAVAKGGV